MTEHAEMAKVIRANNDAFERNVKAQDAAKLVEVFYAENAVLMPQGQPRVDGSARIKEFWGGMFQAGVKEAKLKTEQLDVSGDLASEIGAYTLTMQAEGGQATQATGKYVVVVRKQADGSWKAIADIFNGNGA